MVLRPPHASPPPPHLGEAAAIVDQRGAGARARLGRRRRAQAGEERVGTFFARSGVDVGFRIGRSPDADFKYFTTRVAAFVPTGGRYSELAAEVGAKLGVAVLRVNQSDVTRRSRYVNTC